jgi:EAL domain-containing protein (putative c-di-GMP-specific phosphodiesterase class I)
MLLNHLIDVFNDAFAHEHDFSHRPFILKNNSVNGLFGPIRIGSVFSSIRQSANPTHIVGHAAQIEVAANTNHYVDEDEIASLLADRETYHSNLESIITFDRLSRTVHVLNYLALLPVDQVLFLDVDPRHILGVKKDHGVYFQDFIAKAGLETKNVVVVLTVYSQYARHYQELLAGLENYRRQGYQIALKFDSLPTNKTSTGLITELSPQYIFVSARVLEQLPDGIIEDTLTTLLTLVAQAKSQTILQHVDDKKTDLLARHSGFDYVEGSYYRAIPYDYSRKADEETVNYVLL